MHYALFKDDASPGTDLMVCLDPTHQEEAVMAGKLVFGANPYREICTLHLAGDLLIDKVNWNVLGRKTIDFS